MNIDICEPYHKFALLRIMIVKKGGGLAPPGEIILLVLEMQELKY